MASIDQAFIKAFARRSRPARGEAALTDSSSNQTSQTSDDLSTDSANAEAATIWIDSTQERTLRGDAAVENVIPEPHHVPPIAPINPADHFRSDYVFGDVKQIISPPESSEVEPDEPVVPADDSIEQQLENLQSLHAAPLPDIVTAGNPVTEPLTASEPMADSPAAGPMPEAATTGASCTPPNRHSFEPAWEVDVFDVPAVAADLFFEEQFFETIAQRMRDAVDDGLRSLIVTSAQTGEGRSTIAMGIALAAAATGLRVALVDGDTEEPTLADDLRLELDSGWVDALRGGLPIDQIAVHSVQDGVTLIPLVLPTPGSGAATEAEVGQLMDALQERFDLAIIDGPTSAMPRIQQFAPLVDTVVIARDASRTDDATINDLSDRLQAAGIKGVGVVENFG
jgi:Mrp family chromosome partitioning ATPase